MAIKEMQKLSICAPKKNRKAILELLQSMGNMEIDTEYLDDPDLQKMNTQKARAQFQKNAELFDECLKIIDLYSPAKSKGGGLFSEKEQISKKTYDEIVRNRQQCVANAIRVQRAEKGISDCKGAIIKDKNQIASLQPWMKLDVPMNLMGTKETELMLGTIPGQMDEANLYAIASKELAEPAPVSCQVISSDTDQTCIGVICHRSVSEKVEQNLRAAGFARPSTLLKVTPAEECDLLKADIEEQNRQIENLKNEIIPFSASREDFKIAADYYRTRAEKYRVLGTIPQSQNMFFLEGWVLKDQADAMIKMLSERFGALAEKEDKQEDEKEPTLLHNNRFSESVEGVLESYGLPQHGKVDPTFIMSIFYVIFFGMMLSDAGYGILMAVFSAVILARHKHLADGTRKMMQLFFWCGLSTAFWGFMYGGFFGDALDVIAVTFFSAPEGTTVLKPLWFEPLNQPMRLLVWCMGFGLIHLFTGLGIKGWEYLQNKDILGWVSDVLSWYLFVSGLVLLLLPSELFSSIAGDSFDFSPLANLHGFARAITWIGLLLILVMQERGHKNWGLRIALGAYDVYGITGWLSDVLSYSRLLALGLATGVIANVINMMASMVGKSVPGVLIFIIIFVFGHILNFGINALGAYVHTNRLQFVEFFGKFYDGGGKPFKSFKMDSKYIDVKED